MELSLGVSPYFMLKTRNPIFVNFKLTSGEADLVQKSLPNLKLKKVKFSEEDTTEEYWMSYNLYEVEYPKKELSAFTKVRCEINTFVEDKNGLKGIYVFSGSPYVSQEEKKTILGSICDFAEGLVMFIYGCGKLIKMSYRLTDQQIAIDLNEGANHMSLRQDITNGKNRSASLSKDYLEYNNISFFNGAKTYDRVYANSTFTLAKFHPIDGSELQNVHVKAPFFNRTPDKVYFHKGEITYLVNALTKNI